MAGWKQGDLYRYGKFVEAWFSQQLNDGHDGRVWVVPRSKVWYVEPGLSNDLLAGPFETKEAAMLAAELMFE